MKSSLFNVELDENTGCVTAITVLSDPHKMNWCSSLCQWGRINIECRRTDPYHSSFVTPLTLDGFSSDGSSSVSVYKNNLYSITVSRSFAKNGNLVENVRIKNIFHKPVTVNRDNFAIAFPFNDRYTHADDCMTGRCNTHIWCGINTCYVNALKMGASDVNLGMVLTKGAFVSYSQAGTETNVRGYFELECESVLLKSGEEYELEWEIFVHSGKADFRRRLKEYRSYIGIKAEHYTVFENEDIVFDITPFDLTVAPEVTLQGDKLTVTVENGAYRVRYSPKRLGEHIFVIRCGDLRTYAQFNVKLPFSALTERRVSFLVDKQQCLDSESPLYGAFLVYDNDTESQFFDFLNTDHNACRERLNMAFVIIRYLQLKDDKRVREALDRFLTFMFDQFYEETTGEVYNNIGKTQDALRLYNAPGIMLLFAEMYNLTRDGKYLDSILTLARRYYEIGGEKCYSNAVAIRRVMNAFIDSGRKKDTETMLGYFHKHVNNMLKNGTSYPIHEVNYEQTIVTPAVICVSEMGLYSPDKEKYLEQAKMHLECLDRFSGDQPSYHLNEIALRFWDDYWFGKEKKFGDTLPHHLSCLSARAFIAYYRLSGDRTYLSRAEECIRNCLCLITDDGRGSAAYVYPHTVNGTSGEFFDGWANDQDLPLYDGMNVCDLIDCFNID